MSWHLLTVEPLVCRDVGMIRHAKQRFLADELPQRLEPFLLELLGTLGREGFSGSKF